MSRLPANIQPPLQSVYGDSRIPPIGSPEFRAFVQTPEWQTVRHSQVLRDNKALGLKQEDRAAMRQLEAESPIQILGATGLCERNIWRRDWREQLPIDDPDRMDYEESIYGKTEIELITEDVRRLGILHEVALQITVPVAVSDH